MTNQEYQGYNNPADFYQDPNQYAAQAGGNRNDYQMRNGMWQTQLGSGTSDRSRRWRRHDKSFRPGNCGPDDEWWRAYPYGDPNARKPHTPGSSRGSAVRGQSMQNAWDTWGGSGLYVNGG